MTSYVINTLQCPECHIDLWRMSLRSGNSFGAELFTDGYSTGSNKPRNPFSECPNCNSWIRTSKIPVLGSFPELLALNSRSGKLMIEDKIHSLLPSGIKYKKLLQDKPWRDLEEEKACRILAWWEQANHFNPLDNPKNFGSEYLRYQKIHDHEFEYDRSDIDNMIELLSLLDTRNSYDQLKRAEILRNLGRFDECLLLLKDFDQVDNEKIKAAISFFARGKSRVVRKINGPFLAEYSNENPADVLMNPAIPQTSDAPKEVHISYKEIDDDIIPF